MSSSAVLQGMVSESFVLPEQHQGLLMTHSGMWLGGLRSEHPEYVKKELRVRWAGSALKVLVSPPNLLELSVGHPQLPLAYVPGLSVQWWMEGRDVCVVGSRWLGLSCTVVLMAVLTDLPRWRLWCDGTPAWECSRQREDNVVPVQVVAILSLEMGQPDMRMLSERGPGPLLVLAHGKWQSEIMWQVGATMDKWSLGNGLVILTLGGVSVSDDWTSWS